ncbi:alcohol oxidase [Pyrenochaeta sp. DS3sAY3a]|nr:alcohol oxidase [Pyrenochaeta sp. DS3sAY3a]
MKLVISLIATAAVAQAKSQWATGNKGDGNDTIYDYIVVGSGPGGGPLAANLARNGHSVLLLDAGDMQPNNSNSRFVAENTRAINDPLTRWDFFVTRDTEEIDAQYELTTWRQTNGEFYVGLDPPEGAERLGVYYPRAGTVGGCAMHNAAAISLPASVDWNDIATITGDESWRNENMRQYLVRLERNNYLPNGSTPAHGFNGYLDTSGLDNAWASNTSDDATVLAGMLAASYPELDGMSLVEQLDRDANGDDPNRDNQTGVFRSFTHSLNGTRSSPLQHIMATLNDPRGFPLTLQEHSFVTKVLFSKEVSEGTGPRAIGVEYLRGQSMYSADPRYNSSVEGELGRAYASKEVIISAGAYVTPQILKLSGVGPAAELATHSIPLVKDLPGVGTNMKDNYEGVIYGTFENPVFGFWDVYHKTAVALRSIDIQFYCFSAQFIGFYPGMTGHIPGEFECGFMQLHPRNINGTVKLRSNNPRDMPNIHLGFFSNGDDDDLESMVQAINYVRPFLNSLPNNPYTELRPCAPGVECTDDWQRDYLRKQVYSHHASGSCAIGSDDDLMAVLDSKFRVRGTKGLRVVDGSAFSVQPGSLPSLPTFMISEKALDDILADA